MKTRNGLFADVPENLWNDWHWQVANRAETIEDLKKYMNLTPDEEAGVAKTLGKLCSDLPPAAAILPADGDRPSFHGSGLLPSVRIPPVPSASILT